MRKTNSGFRFSKSGGLAGAHFLALRTKKKQRKEVRIMYQHGEVIQLEYVIRDARVLQIVGSGHHRLHTWTKGKIRTTDWSKRHKLSQTGDSA